MRRIARWLLRLLLILVVFVVTVLSYFTVVEYRPKDIEPIPIENNQDTLVKLDEEFRLMAFNIGYASLGKDEDFVMDGGKKGRPDSKEVVENYLDGILDLLTEYPSDIYLLQEVDVESRRSYYINQKETIHDHLGDGFSSMHILNYKANFVPFPFSFTQFIGRVESGMQTLSSYKINESTRYQLPGAFAWPVRTVNLKRAIHVTRLPIEDSDKELVVINVHLSAYDDGNMRTKEMGLLRDVMVNEYEKGNYVIIGGDFNQSLQEVLDMPKYEVRQDYFTPQAIDEDFLPDSFSFHFDFSVPSSRLLNQPYDPTDVENTHYLIIDGFLVSDNVEVLHVQTIDTGFQHNDHNPVILDVKLQ